MEVIEKDVDTFKTNKPLKTTWERVPMEELFEDGEIDEKAVTDKIYDRCLCKGDWVLIRIKGE